MNYMPQASHGVKKVLIVAGAVLLIAAACNNQTASTGEDSTDRPVNPPVTQTPPVPKVPLTKVDTAVNALNASVDSEDTINMETDDDVIDSDRAIIKSFDGVSNVNF